MRLQPVLFALFLLPGCTSPATVPDDPASRERALRELLAQALEASVNQLARPDGYWRNPRVRIALPQELARVEKGLRRYGLERYAEELEQSLNRAAEAALPAAKPLLRDALRDLSFEDAAALAHGPEDAATVYFRAHTERSLGERLKPALAAATAGSGVIAAYKRLQRKASFLEKLADPVRLDLDAYVTRAALDGLYRTMAEEERRLRRNPLTHPGELLRKVFQ
jgi:hypothetical protein